jgi:phosphoglycerate-specific signal transduction histidine kinase
MEQEDLQKLEILGKKVSLSGVEQYKEEIKAIMMKYPPHSEKIRSYIGQQNEKFKKKSNEVSNMKTLISEYQKLGTKEEKVNFVKKYPEFQTYIIQTKIVKLHHFNF